MNSIFVDVNNVAISAVPLVMVAIGWLVSRQSGIPARIAWIASLVHLVLWLIQAFAPLVPPGPLFAAGDAHLLWGAFFLIMALSKLAFLVGLLLHIHQRRVPEDHAAPSQMAA